MDAEQLGHQYNTRAWAPGFADTLARHRALGEAVRRGARARLDLRWGPSPRQALDFFVPEGPMRAVAFFIHGGYWQYAASTKESVSFLAPAFLERGIGFCAPGYTLCPEVTMDAMVAQLRQAFERTSELVGFGRVVVLGHSAGGHLAATLALTMPGIAGACGVSGLYDLEPLVPTYLNEALRMDAAAARRNSPLHMVAAGQTPFVLAYGALESPEFRRQAEAFAGTVGGEVFALQGMDHYSATEALLEPGPFQTRVMELFE